MLRVNGLFHRVALGRGSHTLRTRLRPQDWQLGARISGSTRLGMTVALVAYG